MTDYPHRRILEPHAFVRDMTLGDEMAYYFELRLKWRKKAAQCSRFDWEARAYANERQNLYANLERNARALDRANRGITDDDQIFA